MKRSEDEDDEERATGGGTGARGRVLVGEVAMASGKGCLDTLTTSGYVVTISLRRYRDGQLGLRRSRAFSDTHGQATK